MWYCTTIMRSGGRVAAGGVRHVQRREGAADAARRQGSGVAVRHCAHGVGEQGEAVPSDSLAGGGILAFDGAGFRKQTFEQPRAVLHGAVIGASHAVEPPEEVVGGGAGGCEACAALVQAAPDAGRVAIRRSLAEDLYIVMPGFELQDQSVTLQVVVNPLVDWIWVGFGILVFGTLLALMPEQAVGLAPAKVPASATTAMLILMLVLAGAPARGAPGTDVDSKAEAGLSHER